MDVEGPKLLEGGEEMFDRAGKAVKPPDQHRLKPTGPDGFHQPIERGPPLLGPREAVVHKLVENLPPPLRRMGSEGRQLHFGILPIGTDTGIERNLHRVCPLKISTYS